MVYIALAERNMMFLSCG